MSVQQFLTWLATGFGAGAMPWMPGTAGALIGLVPAVALTRMRPRTHWIAAIVLLVLAIPICEAGSGSLGGHDDPRIVADELLTAPLITAALPLGRHPGRLAAAFILSRVLDVTKPPPAPAVERLPGGIGIVMDDVVACLWTIALGHLGCRAWRRWTRMGPPPRG